MRAAFVMLLAWTVARGGPLVAEGNEERFLDGLRRIERLLERRHWRAARREVFDLLERHREQSYVFLHQTELLEHLERATFRMGFEEPELEDLLDGEILSYSPRRGDVVIRYHPGRLGDFERQFLPGDPAPVLLHRMVFGGPCEIEVRGESYPRLGTLDTRVFAGSPTIMVGVDTASSFQVLFGLHGTGQWKPATIRRIEHGVAQVVETLEFAPPAGERYVLNVRVGARELVVSCNGERIVHLAKEYGQYGRFGIANLPALESITVSGRLQPGWVQGLIDERAQAALAEFERSWSPEKELPAWLIRSLERAHAPPEAPRPPGPDRPEQIDPWNRAIQLYNAGRFDDGLASLRAAGSSGLTREARLFLEALFLAELDRPDDALARCQELCRLDPHHFDARRFHAHLVVELRPRGEAIAALGALLADFPDDGPSYVDLATLLVLEGRMQEARETIRRARSRGFSPPELASLDRLLVKAEQGPQWSRRYSYTSRHYVVSSDIDRAVCADAAQVLELSHAAFSARLHRVAGSDRQRFPVFIFSSEAGFRAYAADTLGSSLENSAGLYSPGLRQLLIWNLPDRAQTMQTVRHEGFHQYLDRLVKSPPVWLNEGLAEYYEIAHHQGGRWIEGQPHPEHLAVLGEQDVRRPSLRALLDARSEQFYLEPAGHYALSWAFVHYLRHGSPQREQLFDELLRLLVRGTPARLAVERVFAGIDLEAMEGELLEHVATLREN